MSFHSHQQTRREDPDSHVSLSLNIQHLCFWSAFVPCCICYLCTPITELYLKSHGWVHNQHSCFTENVLPPKVIPDHTVLTSSVNFSILCPYTIGNAFCLFVCFCKDLGTSSALPFSLLEDVTHFLSTQLSLTPTATTPLYFIWD